MKVENSLPMQQIVPDRANVSRQETSGKAAPNNNRSAQFSTPETVVAPAEGLSVRDRASFSSKSLSVSAALAGSQAGTSAAPSSSTGGRSSSSIVSSQAEPFLSADEVSFFEKLMRKAVGGYTSTGSYGQSTVDLGGSLALKI